MLRALDRIAVLALVLIVLGDTYDSTRDAPPFAPVPPECGHDNREIVGVQLVAITVNVPEFHDCQRLIVEGASGLEYSGRTAIFASDSIGSFEEHMRRPYRSEALGDRGRVATSSTAATDRRRAPGGPLRGIPIAVVLASETPYQALGIAKALNCLYIWFVVVANDTTWSARMTPTTQAVGCPFRTMDPAMPNDLAVKREVVIDPVDNLPFKNATDYPPVARWDWDSVHRQHYISIGCGIAWCEIGARGFVSSLPLELEAGNSKPLRRVKLIRGWYDQQLLAMHGPKGPTPSRIVGTIIPDTALGSADDLRTPVHVADVAIQGMSPGDPTARQYDAKFNFAAPTLAEPARIYITENDGSTSIWKAQIRRRLGGGFETGLTKNTMFRPVDGAFETAKYKVPGVARWRWMETDEGTWTRCKYGCCEISNY